MLNPPAISYDDVPYDSRSFFETQPNRLAAMAALFGMSPARVDRARVLELGCAGGGNLVPLALAWPEGRFTGIDLSARQIDDARNLAARVGASNVDLRAIGFTSMGEEFGEFDYIIAHGLYSWIAPSLRERLLEVVEKHLAPNGVAYVSYNTYPGWHGRGVVRDLLTYHAQGITDPLEISRRSRTLLEAVVPVVGERGDGFGHNLKEVLKHLQGQGDWYVLHDYLESENHPVYFHEFVSSAAAKGLRYLSEAGLRTMADWNQAPEARAVLDRLSAGDPIAREQYHDYLCNRNLRRSLLCRADVPTSRSVAPEALRTLRVASHLGPNAPCPDPFAAGVVAYRSQDGGAGVATDEPLLKLAMRALTECWPRSLPFEDLHRIVRDHAEPEALGEALLQAFAADVVDLLTHEPGFVSGVSERPVASPLARLQAESGPRVTNVTHRTIVLGPFDALVLPRLDGQRDRRALLDSLVEAATSGVFTIDREGRPITDAAQLRGILGPTLDASLGQFARNALLVG